MLRKKPEGESNKNYIDKEAVQTGVSLRSVCVWIMIAAVVVSALIYFPTRVLQSTFHELTKAANDQIVFDKASHELMEASDYLTERVQRFTVNGDMRFLKEYFTEAFETNRREDALRKLSGDPGIAPVLEQLRLAMNESVDLMKREYYAMRLVIDTDRSETEFVKKLDSVMSSRPVLEKDGVFYTVGFSTGYVHAHLDENCDLRDLFSDADQKMYRIKRDKLRAEAMSARHGRAHYDKAGVKAADYTTQEMKTLLDHVSGMYDLARVVDPIECRILEFDSEGRISRRDRANAALRTIRDDHREIVAYFNEAMMRDSLFEQEIISSFDKALKEGQFRMYLQPSALENGQLMGAESLGMDVVTEGVETETQLALLKAMGCRCFQGYYFSRPVTTEEFEKKYSDIS